MHRVLKYEHFDGYFVVLGLILPVIFVSHTPKFWFQKSVDERGLNDVIFSVIAGLPKVYPNFLDVPHSVLQ